MTIYQEEMQRKAQRYGCITDYDEADQLLLISHKGVHLTAINPEGFMFYNSKELTDPQSREVFSHLVDDAETVREYVGLYESSPQMKPKDVQNYRKFAEYGDVVFAGMYSPKHGFMFCSWRQSDGGSYLADRANKDGECWPAIPTIATELKLSQSTVRRALHDLRKAGLLETEQRYRTKGGKSSLLYKIRSG